MPAQMLKLTRIDVEIAAPKERGNIKNFEGGYCNKKPEHAAKLKSCGSCS